VLSILKTIILRKLDAKRFFVSENARTATVCGLKRARAADPSFCSLIAIHVGPETSLLLPRLVLRNEVTAGKRKMHRDWPGIAYAVAVHFKPV
jgi:hypothetical protein